MSDSNNSEPRLAEIAATLPDNEPFSTSGTGFKLWKTRRANLFKKALAKLTKITSPIDQRRLAAHEISEQIGALQFAASVIELPRGYRLVCNRNGERGVQRNGVMFSPSFAEPLPDNASLEAFAQDLRTGLLGEINAQFCGNSDTAKIKTVVRG